MTKMILRSSTNRFILKVAERGATGPGVPDGGSTGYVLSKKTDANQDTEWVVPPSAPVTSVNGNQGVVVLDAADVDALAIDQNGADIDDTSTFRNNLGLGEAAVADFGTDPGDALGYDEAVAFYNAVATNASDLASLTTVLDNESSRAKIDEIKINSDPDVMRAKYPKLADLQAKIGETSAKTKQNSVQGTPGRKVRIAAIGDSLTRWGMFGVLAEQLAYLYNREPLQPGCGFRRFVEAINLQDGFGSTKFGWDTTSGVTDLTTPSGSSNVGPGQGSALFAPSGYAFTTVSCTGFDVYWGDSPGATLAIALDDPSNVLAIIDPATAGSWSSGELNDVSTEHTLYVINFSGANLYMWHSYIHNGTTEDGIELHRLGHAGWGTAEFIATTNNLDYLTDIDFDGVIMAHGTNDISSGNYFTQTNIFVPQIQAALPNAALILWVPYESTGTVGTGMSALRNQARLLADTYDLPLIDTYEQIGAIQDHGTIQSPDDLHPSPGAMEIISNHVLPYFTGRRTPVYSEKERMVQVKEKTVVDYTLSPIYDHKRILERNSANLNFVTVPSNLPVGFTTEVVQTGAGLTEIRPASGVTLHAPAGLTAIVAQYGNVTIHVSEPNVAIVKGLVGAEFDPVTALPWVSYGAADQLGLSNGDPVTDFTDLTGNGNTPTQATSGNRPTFASSVASLNNNPAVVFDNVDDMLRFVMALSQPYSMFCVFSWSTAPGTNESVMGFNDAVGTRSLGYASSLANFGSSLAVGFGTVNTPYMYLGTSVSGNLRLYANGAAQTPSANSINMNHLTLGANYVSAAITNPAPVRIAEWGVLDSDMTGHAQYASLVNYLRKKYGFA